MSSELSTALIHPAPPSPVSWWPPAPGWWLLLGLTLLLLLLLPRVLRSVQRRRLARTRVTQALHGLPATLPDREWLAAANKTLKRLLKRQGNDRATRLFGDDWLDYLCATYPEPNRHSLQPLAADLYRPDVTLTADQRRALEHELKRWLQHNHV
ncbi:DUF4381 domain-containing protein [Pseudomonas saliphila]|uniref:DUF4381 domain-containing protein n=1 Tax=Pseudomonas saliphila TaxID=2586906 RepID=UPI00123BB268|nr:DUF4381 domain-containing protein [Pseudomonas saliphila]